MSDLQNTFKRKSDYFKSLFTSLRSNTVRALYSPQLAGKYVADEILQMGV